MLHNEKDVAKTRIANMTSVVKGCSRGTIATTIPTVTLNPIQPFSYHKQIAVAMVPGARPARAPNSFKIFDYEKPGDRPKEVSLDNCNACCHEVGRCRTEVNLRGLLHPHNETCK